jgi:hypothetical protein
MTGNTAAKQANKINTNEDLKGGFRRITFSLLFFTSVLSAFFLQSCAKDSTKVVVSSSNSKESHNLGQNCMNCHVSGGGEAANEGGVFYIAGSVYDISLSFANPDATVNMYTGPGGTGTLKYSIPVDKKGNFYATGGVDFGSGLYPSVQGATTVHHMSSPVMSGQCNSCHNVSTAKIWAN